jgi:hypothetical protein
LLNYRNYLIIQALNKSIGIATIYMRSDDVKNYMRKWWCNYISTSISTSVPSYLGAAECHFRSRPNFQSVQLDRGLNLIVTSSVYCLIIYITRNNILLKEIHLHHTSEIEKEPSPKQREGVDPYNLLIYIPLKFQTSFEFHFALVLLWEKKIYSFVLKTVIFFLWRKF